jgi:hypothetical protein
VTGSSSIEADPIAAAQLPELVDALSIPVTVGDIRDADYPRLKAVLSQLKAGLDTSSTSLAQIRRTTRRKPEQQPAIVQDHSPFDFAYAQVRACEVALRTSIEAASTATPENAAELQAKVAQNYEAYSRAVTVAQATAKNYVADNSSSRR